jgi:hypothetical protein
MARGLGEAAEPRRPVKRLDLLDLHPEQNNHGAMRGKA